MSTIIILTLIFGMIALMNTDSDGTTKQPMSDYQKEVINRRVMNKVIRRSCKRMWR